MAHRFNFGTDTVPILYKVEEGSIREKKRKRTTPSYQQLVP
jgi:hypothetical protein